MASKAFSNAKNKLLAKQFGQTLGNKYQRQEIELDAARVGVSMVAIAGQLYPGSVPGDSGTVTNAGRPAAANYTTGSGGTVVVRSTSGTTITGGGTTTTDGVTRAEFVAHTANIDAHHPKTHGIVDSNHHTASGNLYDVVGLSGPTTLALLASTADSHAQPDRFMRADGAGQTKVTTLTAGAGVVTPQVTAPGDLLLDPAGNVVFPNAQTLKSASFDSSFPVQGWSVYETLTAGKSGLTIGSISADEIRTRVFVADETRVDRGEEIVGKSYGFLSLDYTTPAAIGGDGNNIYFDNSPAIAGAIFSDGDWLVFRIFEDATGFSITTIWLQMYSSASGAVPGYEMDTINKRQRWRAVLRQGTTSYLLRKGSFSWDWGQSGQGIIVSSAVDQTGAPYIRMFTWTGNPYTPANRTTHVQLGYLGNAPQTSYLAPSGWGLYAENVFLKGDLVTAGGDIRMLTGAGVNVQEDSGAFWDSSKRALRWWPDVATRTGQPSLSILSSKITSGAPNNQNYSWITSAPADGVWAQLQLDAKGQGGRNDSTVYLSGGSLAAGFPAAINIQSDEITIYGTVSTSMQTVTVEGLRASVSGTAHDLGSVGNPFDTLYVHNIVADSIAGGEALSGQIWQYDDGDMYVRSNASGNRTLFVANSGGGSMHLNVQGDIVSGGAVNGVNLPAMSTTLGALNTAYNSHAADTNIHHNKSHVLATTAGLGADHTVSGLTAGYVLRATSAAAAGFGQLQHDNLGGITPDQHHAKVHVLATSSALGADHTISGATPGHVLRASSPTTAAFNQLQHSDLGGVTPDQHHPRSHSMTSTSDHTYAGGAALDLFGLTAPSTLGVITPSSNPGAAERVLKTTTAGGLTVQTLATANDATVGQSLFAGGSNLRVIHHTTPTPHVHLVVNPSVSWTVDEQFGVDIDDSLLVRGWIVGKHAIQIKGATLISHFDGPEPHATNYTGEATGHMGQVAAMSGGVIYRPGKFGKGIQIAEGLTNLVTNPSFEVDLAGWSTLTDSGATGTRTRDVTRSLYGVASYKIVKNGGSNGANYGVSTTIPVVLGQSYTASAWIYVETLTGTTPQVAISLQGNMPNQFAYLTTTTSGWVRVYVTGTATGTGNATLYLYFENGLGTFYIDGVQVENRAYMTPYLDGSLGAGHAWTGLAHASTSTRTVATFSYATPTLGTAWTVGFWAYRYAKQARNWGFLFLGSNYGSDSYNAVYYDANNHDWITGFNAGAPADGWHYYTIAANGTARSAYRDGVLIGSGTNPYAPVAPWLFGGNGGANTVLDDLLFVDRELSADEVRAIYESDAPVFGETSTWQWRSANNLVWADGEGLWMLDSAGNAVLGAAGVNSKGWGGLTLDQGDFMLGNTQKGYMLFDAGTQDLALTMAVGAVPFLRINSTQGIEIENNTSNLNDNRALSWNTGGVNASFVKGYSDGVQNFLQVEVAPLATRDSQILMRSISTNTEASQVSVQALRQSATGASLVLHSATNDDYIEMSATQTDIYGRLIVHQESTTAAVPTLQLTQSDISEEYIRFDSLVIGAGQPIDTAALGAYYGKIRVSVNGQKKWLAVYN